MKKIVLVQLFLLVSLVTSTQNSLGIIEKYTNGEYVAYKKINSMGQIEKECSSFGNSPPVCTSYKNGIKGRPFVDFNGFNELEKEYNQQKKIITKR